MSGGSKSFYNAEQKLWSGLRQKELYKSNVTLGELVVKILSRNPEHVIQIHDPSGASQTAATLLHNSKLMAISIRKFGLQTGDIVGINATNTPHLTAVIIGAFLCGTPTNSVFPGFDVESIKIIYKITKPKVIFCDVENYERTKTANNELGLNAPIILMNGELPGVPYIEEFLVDEGSDLESMTFPCAQLNGDATVAIFCSSGTTGSPKAVCCSHNIFIRRPWFSSLTPDSVLFTFSTMYWISGFVVLTASLLNGVTRIITDRAYSPQYFMDLVEKRGVTHILSGSYQLAQLLPFKEDRLFERCASIRAFLSGGSRIPPTVTEQLGKIAREGILPGYGMSEASIITLNNDARQGSVGKLVPNTEMRVINDIGEPCGPNTEGILYVRNSCYWAGYYDNPEATQNTYKDGWLNTGDIGYFDDDGFLYLCGRQNDVFKSNGFQIYPERIEDVLIQLPGVAEVCAVPKADFVAVNLIACAIVRVDNDIGARLTTQIIEEHVQKYLDPVFHLTGGIYFFADLPKTASGKVQRRKVIEMIELWK